MKVTPVKIKIRDIVEGFYDNDENGARGYGGRLDIRPPAPHDMTFNEVIRALSDKDIREALNQPLRDFGE